MKKNDDNIKFSKKESESKGKLENDKSKQLIKLDKKGETKDIPKSIHITKEKLKSKVPRLKLNENLLFYNNIGVRKLYEYTENLNFSDKLTEVILI